MSDDTARSSTEEPPAPNLSMSKIVVLGVLAILILVLAGLMFTLSFDSLRALAVEIGVRPTRAWMAPVAIDIAQAAATLALGVIGTSELHKRARWFCMSLAAVTVVLSVAGNSYHAYQLAERNAARVAAGEDLGFIPQPAPIAACIAAIFPFLWLALLHMFNTVAKVIAAEAVARPETVAAADAVPTTPNTPHTAPPHLQPAPAAERAEPVRTLDAHHDEISAHAAEPVHTTLTGWPQTTEGLRAFLAAARLGDEVKEVAEILIHHPGLKQSEVARRVSVDRSTVSRRWKTFVEAATEEGFTVPPLPKPMLDTVAEVRELQPA